MQDKAPNRMKIVQKKDRLDIEMRKSTPRRITIICKKIWNYVFHPNNTGNINSNDHNHNTFS